MPSEAAKAPPRASKNRLDGPRGHPRQPQELPNEPPRRFKKLPRCPNSLPTTKSLGHQDALSASKRGAGGRGEAIRSAAREACPRAGGVSNHERPARPPQGTCYPHHPAWIPAGSRLGNALKRFANSKGGTQCHQHRADVDPFQFTMGSRLRWQKTCAPRLLDEYAGPRPGTPGWIHSS